MGGKSVIVEKRERFSRNNVLHLWPYLIHDLKAFGAKKFFGKFCAGSIDHISKWSDCVVKMYVRASSLNINDVIIVCLVQVFARFSAFCSKLHS